MKTPAYFLVIDDDPLNNLICRTVIARVSKGAQIKTFTKPEEGMSFIEAGDLEINTEKPAILFLDINMPTMTGWEFLQYFEKLDEATKNKIKVFILSSSVDERDIERAESNKYVVDYLVKPLRMDAVDKILKEEFTNE